MPRFTEISAIDRPFKYAVIMLCAALAACTSPVVPPENQQPERFAAWTDTAPEYRLGPGDELSVLLPYNSEMNYTGLVGPDSRFIMPIAGSFTVDNLTADQLQDDINKKLARYVLAPNATVVVRKYAQGVYVGGEVRSPGQVNIQGRMDLLAAITMAGGTHDTARKDEVVVIRRSPSGQPMIRTVDINSFVKTGNPTNNLILQPLDIVFVPKSNIAEVNQWIDQFINRTLPFARNLNYSFTNDNGTTR